MYLRCANFGRQFLGIKKPGKRQIFGKKSQEILFEPHTSGRTDMKIENHGFSNEEQTWDQKSRPTLMSDIPSILGYVDITNQLDEKNVSTRLRWFSDFVYTYLTGKGIGSGLLPPP
jgi:hypothetical protein